MTTGCCPKCGVGPNPFDAGACACPPRRFIPGDRVRVDREGPSCCLYEWHPDDRPRLPDGDLVVKYTTYGVMSGCCTLVLTSVGKGGLYLVPLHSVTLISDPGCLRALRVLGLTSFWLVRKTIRRWSMRLRRRLRNS